MFHSLRTLLVQSAVFGLLVVVLSLWAVEVLPDGRVVMVLGDWEVAITTRDNYPDIVWVHILTDDVSASDEQFEVRFISVKKFVNNKLVRWVYENVPTTYNWIPVRFQADCYHQVKIGVSLEQKARIMRAMNDGRIVLIASE